MRFVRWVLPVGMAAAAASGSAQVLSPQGLEEAALLETGAERPPWRGRDWYMLSPEKREDRRRAKLRAAVKRLLEHNERELRDEQNELTRMKLDTSRDLATIYTAEASDFPELADLFLRDSGTVRPLSFKLLEPVVRRWCDFDPKAALEWLHRHAPWTWHEGNFLVDADGGAFASITGHLECVIAEEAIDDYPEWALALRRWTTTTKYNVERLYRMERFLYHLAKGQPERSAEFLEKVDDRVVEFGFGGWLEAMIEMDRLTQIEDLIERFTGDAKEWREDTFLDCLIEKNPAEARRRAESGLTPEWADRWIALHVREEEGEEAAVKWFMDRAPENKLSRERAERIGQVAEHLILVNSEQIKWVEEMERRGEDTSFAYGVLAKRAAKDGRMKDAYRFLEKTREFIRKEVMEAVLREEMEDITLMARREGRRWDFEVYLPAPGARKRVEEAGLSDAFERLLRRRNVDRWTSIVNWMEQSHGELESLLEEVREAVASEEEQE